MRQTAEIGIVGAGPAGARAAELLARRGVSVVMLDPKAPWEKPCGGGLTPSAFDAIPELEELKSQARPIDRVRVEVDPEEGFLVRLERPMWILSRRTLGRWQLERALQAGAVHLPVKVRSIRRALGAWRLETDGGPVEVSFLVGADGGASLVRRVAAPKLDVELAPTRVAYPPQAGPTPDTAVLKFYPNIAGYLWDFPRPDHRSVGVGVQNGTWRRSRLDGEIDEYRRSSEPCSCPGLERAGAVIGTAQFGHGDFSSIAGDGFALLGDAAGFADPLTGEGIHNALRSGELLADAWLSGDPRRYPKLARRAFEREFQVARVIRRFVFEGDAGIRLVHRGFGSDVWYAAVGTVVNAFNEHDGNPFRLLRGWARTWRDVRRTPSVAERVGRVPVPCGCSDDGTAQMGQCQDGPAAA